MNKLIVFTMGGKGGVGKTAAVASLIEYYDFHSIPRTIIDCDTENKKAGSLKKFFPEAEKVNIRKADGLDVFLDIAGRDDAPVVVADLGAGSGADLITWFEDMYPAAASLNISFLAVGSITSNPGSLETVFSWGSSLQDKVKYLIVKNLFHGPIKLWDEGNKASEFRKAFSVAEITVKSRIPEWQTELENHGLTLTQALSCSHPVFSKISAKCRLEMWRNQIFNEFSSVNDILVP